MKYKALFNLVTVALGMLLISACSKDPNSPGYEYMPDMYRSPAIEPYVDHGEIRGRINESVKNQLSALTPPDFTIPYYGKVDSIVQMMLPYKRLADSSYKESHGMFNTILGSKSEYDLAKNDINPIKLSANNSERILKKGKELFTAMCQHCHGEKGDGNGPMVLSGAYVGSGIPNYKTLDIKEGQMFYSIYYGKNKMGSHSSQLNKQEIWTIVHYIKSLQNKDYGKFDENGNPKISNSEKAEESTEEPTAKDAKTGM